MGPMKTEQGRLAPVLHRRRLILTLYLLMIGVAFPGLLLIQTDNSPRAFFADDHQALLGYQHFEDLFGRDRGFRVVIGGPGLWTREGLEWLAEVERETSGWTGVVTSIGLYGHQRWDASDWPPDPEAFRKKVASDPLDRAAGWITADGRATVFVVLSRLQPGVQNRLLGRLERFIAKAPHGLEVELAGLPLVQRAVDREVSHFMRTLFPALILLAVALLAAAFRNVWDVARTLAPAVVCQIVLMGAMGYAGIRLNLVLILLAPLLFVISIATAVHIMVLFRKLASRGLSPCGAVSATYREKGWAVLWTGVTTFAGFSSLAVAEVPPVRAFGVWAGLGIAFLIVVCFTLLPALLAIGGQSRKPIRGGGIEGWAGRRGEVWANWAVRHHRTVFALFGATALLLALGGPRLRLDANALNYLRRDNPVRAGMERLEQAGVGSVSAELVLTTGPSSPALDTPDSLRRLRRLSGDLRSMSHTLGAVGPGDVVESASHLIDESPGSGDAGLAETVRRMREGPETRPILGAFLTRDGRSARVTILTEMTGFGELQPLYEEAARRARLLFPGAGAMVTGQYPLVLAAQRSLLSTMIYSLSLTLAAVTLVFLLLTRGVRLAAMALIPNLWPVVFVLGGLGWLALPLDSSTIMIASVVLGLAVDDTLHALGAFRRAVGEAPPADAAVAALRRTAPGHILTTIVLSLGFAVCSFSTFVPVSRFGLVTALAMAGALAADLWLVPALLGRLAERDLKRFRRD